MEASDATSPTSQTYNGDDIFCECNMRSSLQTSRTDGNPGRRFFGCPKYQTSACGFFTWYDPPTCKRGMKFGRMILKENRELKRTLKEMQQLSSIKGNEEMQRKIDELERRNQDLERVMIHELLKAKSSGKNFWKMLCFVLVFLWIVISLCNPLHKPIFLSLP